MNPGLAGGQVSLNESLSAGAGVTSLFMLVLRMQAMSRWRDSTMSLRVREGGGG